MHAPSINENDEVWPCSIDSLKRLPRFHVNLQNGYETNSNIILRINPTFGETNTVIRNNREDGVWHMQRDSGSFPFQAGQDCLLVVQALEERKFKIVCHGSGRLAVFIYTSTQSIDAVSHVAIGGNLTLRKMRFPGGIAAVNMENSLNIGDTIYLYGYIRQNATDFNVDLQSSEAAPDISLHFEPTVSPNCREMEQRNTASRSNTSPFNPGGWFRITLYVAGSHRFKIECMGNGGDMSYEFVTAMSGEKVNRIATQGGVSLTSLRFNESNSKCARRFMQ